MTVTAPHAMFPEGSRWRRMSVARRLSKMSPSGGHLQALGWRAGGTMQQMLLIRILLSVNT